MTRLPWQRKLTPFWTPRSTPGIRHVDAARSYGRAEDFVATWLRKREIEPGEVTVASKWGYTYTAGWSTSATQHEVKDHSLAAFERQLAESLERLGPHRSIKSARLRLRAKHWKTTHSLMQLRDYERKASGPDSASAKRGRTSRLAGLSKCVAMANWCSVLCKRLGTFSNEAPSQRSRTRTRRG